MNKFEVLMHAQDISDVFWRNLAIAHQAEVRASTPYLQQERLVAEHLREKADYNTGSIPVATAIALLILAYEIKPERTFELGTFIGNSTRALALHSTHVWTCDSSNDIGLGIPNVTQYRKTVSTVALQAYKDDPSKKDFPSRDGLIELLFLDGRILDEDAALLAELTNDDTVIALDDCYQLEKGMVNVNALAMALKGRPLFYLPPPRGEPFAMLGVPGGITLGLLVHPKRLVITKA